MQAIKLGADFSNQLKKCNRVHIMRTFEYNSWLSSVANKSDPRLICRAICWCCGLFLEFEKWSQSVPVIFFMLSNPLRIGFRTRPVCTNQQQQSGTTAFSSIFRLEGE